MAIKIVITSGKGGVGKTTVTANLGIGLANLKKRVLLIDLDFGLNNLDVVLGVENKVLYDLKDVLDGKCRPRQALIEIEKVKNLFILPSNHFDSLTEIKGQNIKVVLESLSPYFDYILIDCPAGLENGFYRAVSICDRAIVVATPNISSIRDSNKTIEILRGYKLDKIYLAVNRVRGDLILSNKMLEPSDVADLLKTKLIAVLPEEDIIFLSNGMILPPTSESYKAYKFFSENLIYGKGKLIDSTSKYCGFFGSIKRKIKGII